jgi:hypothetical protein
MIQKIDDEKNNATVVVTLPTSKCTYLITVTINTVH